MYPKKKPIFCLFHIKVLSSLVVALNPWTILDLPPEPAVKVRSYTAVLGILLGHSLKTTNLFEQVWWPASSRPSKTWTFPSCTRRSSVPWPVPTPCLLLQLPWIVASGLAPTVDMVTWPFLLKETLKQLSYTLMRDVIPASDFCFWTGQHLFTVLVHLLVK